MQKLDKRNEGCSSMYTTANERKRMPKLHPPPSYKIVSNGYILTFNATRCFLFSLAMNLFIISAVQKKLVRT